MGLDYRYQGSTSYHRFDTELTEVVKILGGIPTEEFLEAVKNSKNNYINYLHGVTNYSKYKDMEKFVFPDGTNEVLVRWANHPYAVLTSEETDEIWKELCVHPEIEEVSSQIYNEFADLHTFNEGWFPL